MIDRTLTAQVLRRLRESPAVALLGPRQCGKSTLAGAILQTRTSCYLDLERPSDRAQAPGPEAFFKLQKGRLVFLDEVQWAPEIFPVLRNWRQPGRQWMQRIFAILAGDARKRRKKT